uniref:Putative secreted protein n=1 Tax=Ixodes ricinus TaxID=34613 RepID=A0A147BCZ8_IXORI
MRAVVLGLLASSCRFQISVGFSKDLRYPRLELPCVISVGWPRVVHPITRRQHAVHGIRELSPEGKHGRGKTRRSVDRGSQSKPNLREIGVPILVSLRTSREHWLEVAVDTLGHIRLGVVRRGPIVLNAKGCTGVHEYLRREDAGVVSYQSLRIPEAREHLQ